jgi:hypothetical protein
MRGKVAQIGLDGHRTFSNATGRDGEARVSLRRRPENTNRPALAQERASGLNRDVRLAEFGETLPNHRGIGTLQRKASDHSSLAVQ